MFASPRHAYRRRGPYIGGAPAGSIPRRELRAWYKGTMAANLILRTARADERLLVEGLQRRASLVWAEYRDAILAHPDAIELPPDQIEEGRVCVAEDAG